MFTPRVNYYPPAGQVVNQTDPSVTWNGRQWIKNGRTFTVPSSHRLIGRPGGPLDGWYYDWGRRAWMEPQRGNRPTHPPGGGRAFPGVKPGPQPNPQPQPQPQPPAPQPEKKEPSVSTNKETNLLEAVIKHPIAPLAGVVLLLGSMLSEEPAPPVIPPNLPDDIGKTWQMIYQQNLSRYHERKQTLQVLGAQLLNYGEANAIYGALPRKTT
jgi:hypothetical protein